MPKIVQYTESVHSRVSLTTKTKIERYKEKYRVTEGEIIRRALKKFLANTPAKRTQKIITKER